MNNIKSKRERENRDTDLLDSAMYLHPQKSSSIFLLLMIQDYNMTYLYENSNCTDVFLKTLKYPECKFSSIHYAPTNWPGTCILVLLSIHERI
jgi:hypothetical protein